MIKALGLTGGLGLFKYLGIALGIAALVCSFYYLSNKIDQKDQKIIEYEKALATTSKKLNDVIILNNETTTTFNRYKVDQSKLLTVLNKKHKQALIDQRKIETIKGEINHAQKDKDDIAAPILTDTFNRLRQFKTN